MWQLGKTPCCIAAQAWPELIAKRRRFAGEIHSLEPVMRKTLSLMAAAGAALALTACGHNVEQRASTGAVAGAVVGGPVGAAAGAAAGTVVSKTVDK
jgi:osmotically inducible lipoprotein OsmB